MITSKPAIRWGVVALLTTVPVVAYVMAACVAEALDGRPASIAFTFGESAIGALVLVAPCVALACWACRTGYQRGAVVASLSLLAAALGADSAINTAHDAAQIVILFPIVFAPIAFVAAGLGSLVGFLVSLACRVFRSERRSVPLGRTDAAVQTLTEADEGEGAHDDGDAQGRAEGSPLPGAR